MTEMTKSRFQIEKLEERIAPKSFKANGIGNKRVIQADNVSGAIVQGHHNVVFVVNSYPVVKPCY